MIRGRKYSDYGYAINFPRMCQIEIQRREEYKTYSLFYRSVEELTLPLNISVFIWTKTAVGIWNFAKEICLV